MEMDTPGMDHSAMNIACMVTDEEIAWWYARLIRRSSIQCARCPISNRGELQEVHNPSLTALDAS